MLVSQLVSAHAYNFVQGFIVQVLDEQFSDVRAMLQLPRPDIGIIPACNFAIVSSLCNLISGISTTIYKPPKLPPAGRSKCDSGQAFQGVVHDFFPYTPPGANDFPKQLYQFCRNPLAHSVGLKDAAEPVVYFTRIFDPAHADVGWSDRELEDLERPGSPFQLPHPGIVIDPPSPPRQYYQWTLHCDSFYLDVIKLLQRLTADTTQVQAAENRFRQGVFNWRR